jgi:hypothetical protein
MQQDGINYQTPEALARLPIDLLFAHGGFVRGRIETAIAYGNVLVAHEEGLARAQHYYDNVYGAERDARTQRMNIRTLITRYLRYIMRSPLGILSEGAEEYNDIIAARERNIIANCAYAQRSTRDNLHQRGHVLERVRGVLVEIRAWLFFTNRGDLFWETYLGPGHVTINQMVEAETQMQFILEQLEGDRGLAVMESQHSRLGQNSRLRQLDPHLLESIHQMSLVP